MALPEILRKKASLLHDAAVAVARGIPMPFDFMSDEVLLQIDGGDAFADDTLTLALQPADGETVTVGLQTYTFKTVLSSPAVPNEVLIGATTAISADNLHAAMNADPAGVGTLFGTGTLENFDITALSPTNTVVVTARNAGVAGNAIAATETLAGAGNVWATPTLTGGTDFVATIDFEAALDEQPGHFNPIAATPLDGGAVVTSATGPGAFRLNVAGILQFQAPISSYASGNVSVRVVHRSKAQG